MVCVCVCVSHDCVSHLNIILRDLMKHQHWTQDLRLDSRIFLNAVLNINSDTAFTPDVTKANRSHNNQFCCGRQYFRRSWILFILFIYLFDMAITTALDEPDTLFSANPCHQSQHKKYSSYKD